MSSSLFLENWLGLLDLLLAHTPLVLQVSVETSLVDGLGPPFTPASQEDLLGVFGEIFRLDGAEEVLGAYERLVSTQCHARKYLTLGHRFSIRHVHGQAQAGVLCKLGVGDEAG